MAKIGTPAVSRFFNAFAAELKPHLEQELVLDNYNKTTRQTFNSSTIPNNPQVSNIKFSYIPKNIQDYRDLVVYYNLRSSKDAKAKPKFPLIAGNLSNFRGNANDILEQQGIIRFKHDNAYYEYVRRNRSADLTFTLIDNDYSRAEQITVATETYIENCRQYNVFRADETNALFNQLRAEKINMELVFAEHQNISWEEELIKELEGDYSEVHFFRFTTEVMLYYILPVNTTINLFQNVELVSNVIEV